jgi:hypothetical protein
LIVDNVDVSFKCPEVAVRCPMQAPVCIRE